MRIPKQIVICGRLWKVKRVSNLVMQEDEVSPDKTIDGLMLPQEREIHLNADLKGEHLLSCFLHEFNHAVLAEIGLHNTTLHPDLEELIVDNIARQYANTFRLRLKPTKSS